MSDASVNFSVLCEMLEAIARSKKGAMKRKHIRTFLEHVYRVGEYFSAIRLIMPGLDRERGAYKLKEAQLARHLTEALGISKDSHDAQKLLNWRKGGQKAGANAGNFPMVALEVLYQRQRTASGGLKIKDVNDLLDRLAAAENREDKTVILAELINKTNAMEMKWILMIILKDLKLGMSEKTLFHEFHPDAEDMFNVTCDLKMVCDKLKDRNERFKRQDIEVGKAVRPQLASRVPDVETAWKKMHGKEVVVECKFDGDRIQIHKNGDQVHFFSRNFFNHTEYEPGMSRVILENIQVDKCILDGEMLVWDKGTNRFADFGTNQEIAKSAREGLETNQQLCYVVFDILYAGDTSVIHQSLRERHKLLCEVVKPLKGRLELLLPEGSLNSCHSFGEPSWSFIAASVEEVAKFFQETVDNRDEGIILKDLDSKWEPSDRSGKWLKLKPDYINTGSDLDVLIIGGYFGSGRRGGEVAQFLLGLAQNSTSSGYPTRFLSFCRVGTGLSDEECDVLVSKLKPYFRRHEDNSKVPSFYTVTNNAKERPDVWIDRPEKSIILEITSDVRMIKSEVFASPFSLRFPRIRKVRYDKSWYECLDVQTFTDLVQSRSVTTRAADYCADLDKVKPKRRRHASKGGNQILSVVPSHMLRTDVSNVKRETLMFLNLMFYIVNVPSDFSLEQFHKMVVEHGGSFSMNLNDSVTHSIAADKRGIKYQAAVKHGDVIHYSWVIDCCKEKALLPLRPKYFLSLSELSKENMKEDIDAFGDHYFWDLDVSDLGQLFDNLEESKVLKTITLNEHYKKKYCPSNKWCLFNNCSSYFHRAIHSINIDSQTISELTLRRLKLEFLMHGGSVTGCLADATHAIIFSTAEHAVPFKSILVSLTTAERNVLQRKGIPVVSHVWLEDSLQEQRKLPESAYSLRNNMHVHEASLTKEMEDPVASLHEGNSSHKNIQQCTATPENIDDSEKHSASQSAKQRAAMAHRETRNPPGRQQTKAFRYSDSSSESHTSNENSVKHGTVGVKNRKNQERSLKNDKKEMQIKYHSKAKERMHEDEKQGKDVVLITERSPNDSKKGRKRQKTFEENESLHGNDGKGKGEPVTGSNSIPEDLKMTSKDFSPKSMTNAGDSVQAMLADMLPNFDFKNGMPKDIPLVTSSEPLKEQNIVDIPGSEAALQKKKRVSYKDIVGHLLDDK